MADSLIEWSTFEAHTCPRTDAVHIRLVGTVAPLGAACGHCGELIYPEFWVIRHHTFGCDAQGVATWYSSDLKTVVHRCNQPSQSVDIERFLDLAATA